ncbi:fimbria/pilus periplasmic chaperone [Erwinia sp. E_sp_B04_8]|uniref:fimbria/pilus periplasmic chaperone n=2 Tax=Erwinia TaxID=551 RepID=UPI0030D3CDF4
MLGGTRIIYPAGQKQVSMSVRNTSDQSSFLVQSWVEQPDGQKSQNFVATPPLYVSGPGNENTLRLMYVGEPARTDQETLYYFNTKAIPSLDKKKTQGKNMLLLAAVTRIKLFLRPEGLTPPVGKAPSELKFHRTGHGQLRIDNPTPYHLTLVEMKVGGNKLPDTMVSPHENASLSLPATASGALTYRTINDFGAATSEIRVELK